MRVYEQNEKLYAGKKYDSSLSLAEITMLLKSDIKQAIKKGEIAKDLKIRVGKGGKEIAIKIEGGINFQYLSDEELHNFINDKKQVLAYELRYSKATIELLQTLHKIGCQYQDSGQISNADMYFHSNFHLSVGVNWEYEKQLIKNDITNIGLNNCCF